MKIVINSYIKNTIALNHLLDSMKQQSEFTSYDIIVVLGGYYNNKCYEIYRNVEKVHNITYIRCNHNSIDFTGLITLLELYSKNKDDYYFYLHDTCKIGDNFFKKLQSIDLTNVSSIKLNKWFSMNMGIYSQEIINQSKEFLLSKKNTHENRSMEFKCVNFQEDFIFNNDPNNILLDNYDGPECSGEQVDYYNTGTMRIVEYYPNIDLYKIKANWREKSLINGIWTLNL
jgi:hypothetical protein